MITGQKAQVRVPGTSLLFEDEPTINIGNQYSIIDRTKKTWNQSKPIIITPTPEPGDSYQIDYASGYIVFDKHGDRGEITISGEYLPTSILGVATGFSLEKGREFTPATVLGNIDKVEYPTMKTISGSIELLEVENDYLVDKLNNGERLLIEFQIGERVEPHWVYLDKVGINAQPGLVKRNISFLGA